MKYIPLIVTIWVAAVSMTACKTLNCGRCEQCPATGQVSKTKKSEITDSDRSGSSHLTKRTGNENFHFEADSPSFSLPAMPKEQLYAAFIKEFLGNTQSVPVEHHKMMIANPQVYMKVIDSTESSSQDVGFSCAALFEVCLNCDEYTDSDDDFGKSAYLLGVRTERPKPMVHFYMINSNVDKEGFRGFDFEYKLEYNIILCDRRDRGHEDFSDYDVVVREAFIEKDSGAINEGSMGCWQYCGGNDTDTMPCICDEPDQTCDDKAYLECLYQEAEYMGYGKREHAEYYDLRAIVVESTGNISYGYINLIGSVDAHITSDELNIESVFKNAPPGM